MLMLYRIISAQRVLNDLLRTKLSRGCMVWLLIWLYLIEECSVTLDRHVYCIVIVGLNNQNTTKIFADLRFLVFSFLSCSVCEWPLWKAEELKRAATAWVMAARERQPWTKAAVTRAFPTQTTNSRGRNMKFLLFFYKKKHYSANFKVGRGSKGLDEMLLLD